MNRPNSNRRSHWYAVRDGFLLGCLLIVSIVAIVISFYSQGQFLTRIDSQLSSSLSQDVISITREIPSSLPVPEHPN